MVWSLLPIITNTASVISTQGHSFLGRLHFGSKILFLDFFERMTTTNLLHWAAHFRIQSACRGCLTACPYQLHWCRSQEKFGGGERIGRWVWFPIWPTPEGPENFSRASCSKCITSAGSAAALSDTRLLFGHLESPLLLVMTCPELCYFIGTHGWCGIEKSQAHENLPCTTQRSNAKENINPCLKSSLVIHI